jgi:hypothetical protein
MDELKRFEHELAHLKRLKEQWKHIPRIEWLEKEIKVIKLIYGVQD